ncbi:MAG: indolepyruvate ferredoxin oxidoreductase family protein [Burkholderiales bacterium]|nr:indolepyruvate ferredoxin oxidoreductase family protein [Burkholderiales bacterium]
MTQTLARPQADLEERYSLRDGYVYLTGMQALVRLPVQQRLRDQAAGLNTGGYISGYRGSPMGRYDMELWAAGKLLEQHNIVFRAGLNEDLAATAVWGSQMVGSFPGATVDGVFGLWYGKGPGVDRSADALRHANLAGTSPQGGVLCLAGDDHGAKSSTVANFSDGVFMAVGMPLLYPSNTQELLDYGLHGIAMSRYSGCWVGMKLVTDVVEGGGSVRVGADSPTVVLPPKPSEPVDMFGKGYHIRPVDMPLAQEDRLYHHKHAAVLAYARANGLNRISVNPEQARVGIVAAGKAWQDLQQALGDLGLDEARLAEIGVRLLKIGLIWPLDPAIVREFARGLATVVVVEEKRPVLEDQLRSALYGQPAAPRIVGKHAAGGIFDPGHGDILFPNAAETNPVMVARVLAGVLGQALPNCGLAAPAPVGAAGPSGMPQRAPSFCSGCPHNRSTKVVEGSRALAGIGCHTMAVLANPKTTNSISHMGAEGILWLGQQPFTTEKHVFANLGDGTFSHSGLLAVRQAIAAQVPITYKLLYNGFVSMTGGQSVETGMSAPQIASVLHSEGVKKMAVVTDDPSRYERVALPPGVPVHHRDEMEAVQREFREYGNVSVILYDQPCATERRRLRKRGKWADPPKRSFINAAVCEGCGDCGKVSNCMSIEPLETDLGRKRHINQASCNKDYSCVSGFCPSFVTVHGGALKKPAKPAEKAAPAWTHELPEPALSALTRSWGVLVGGIGGSGVVTIGQTLAVAAHLQGLYSSNLDVTGLAQKYGAVHSHVHISPTPEGLHATRIAAGGADALIGCDLVVAAGDESVSRLRPGSARAVVSTDLVPTADFARNPDWQIDNPAMVARLQGALGERVLMLQAGKLATDLLGDPIGANMMMLGAAWQRGDIPLKLQAIERAIELNGVAIPMNKAAFLWGRRAAHDLQAVQEHARALAPAQVIEFVPRTKRSLDEIVRHRSEHLVAHTGEALAQRYRALVERVRQAESGAGLGDALARAVAHNYHRVLAVKDEWEVARLYSHPDFKAALEREFEGDYKLHFHVGGGPFAKTDKATGQPLKTEIGPWMLTAMQWLARLRGLRGSWLDPFRRSDERKLDAHVTEVFEADVEMLLRTLSPATHAVAVKWLSLPEQVRGYGHVKREQMTAAGKLREQLRQQHDAALAPQAKAARSPRRNPGSPMAMT